MTSRYCFVQSKHIQGDCLSFVKYVIWQEGGGVWGSSPRKKFGINGVKSCNFRQNKHGNGTFIKARGNCVWREKGLPFEFGSDSDFSNIYTMYDTGERSEPEKNIKIRWKQPLDPSPTHQTSTQDPTSDKSQGGSGPPVPPPPLDPRMTITKW